MASYVRQDEDLLIYCAELNANDDLLGIGVRIAFYLQLFLSAALALLPHADFLSSSWALNATFWALLLSSILQWNQRNLTLLQAVIASYLLFLHALASTLCILPSYGNFRESKSPTMPAVVVFVVLSNLGASIFGITVAVTGPYMGPGKECNELARLQILFFRLSPAGNDRYYLLAFNVIYLISFIYISIFQFSLWIYREGHKGGEITPDCLIFTLDHFKKGIRKPSDILYLKTNTFLRQRIWVYTLVMDSVWWVSIINVEYTLHLNGVRGTSAASFGQTLALFTLAVPIEAVGRWIVDWNNHVSKKPDYNLKRDRIFRAITSIFFNIGESLFAPFILMWMMGDYAVAMIRHKWFGAPHPYGLSRWK